MVVVKCVLTVFFIALNREIFFSASCNFATNFEEPVPPEGINALKQVKENTNAPICVGERLYTRADFIPILDEQDDAFIKTFFDSLTSKRFITSAIAALGLLIASTAVFSSVRKSINAIWGIEKKRTFIQERAIDFTLIFFASSLLLISFILTTGLSFLSELITITFPDSPLRDPTIWSRLTLLIPPLLTFLVFFICLWWLPNVKLRFIDVFPAAFLAAIAEEINKMVFILYLRNFSGISGSIYGGVSAIIVLMAFIYISAIILLIGAQITARFTVYLSVRKLNKQNKILKLSLDRLN